MTSLHGEVKETRKATEELQQAVKMGRIGDYDVESRLDLQGIDMKRVKQIST